MHGEKNIGYVDFSPVEKAWDLGFYLNKNMNPVHLGPAKDQDCAEFIFQEFETFLVY